MQKRPIKRSQPHTDPSDPVSQAPNAESVADSKKIDEARQESTTNAESTPDPPKTLAGSKRPEEKAPGKHNQ